MPSNAAASPGSGPGSGFNPVTAISRPLTRFVSRYLPDPLIFAIFLTVLVFALAIALTPKAPLDLVQIWGKGFWGLLMFTTQMAMVLVTGHALASSEPVKALMVRIARIAKTPAQGAALVCFAAASANVLNWGFGLIVGAMFAREVARRLPKADYRLLIAAAYIGFMTWHGGFSGSVPLAAATKGNPMEKTIGLIPIADTIFTTYNVVITLALIVVLPIVCRLMHPRAEDVVAIDPALLKPEPSTRRVLSSGATPAERVEESRILGYGTATLGLLYLVLYFRNGGTLDINTMNLIMLVAGLYLHGTLMAYARAVVAGVKGTGGIVLQFPFYAGIQAVMEQSGLGGLITNGFVAIADRHSFPILAFFSSAVINFAVPSGGGHWVVQGPFIMPAAKALGVAPGKAAMAIAYGEEWMNMAQPFWALPALAIAGLGVRDIMGYCVTALIVTAPIFVLGLLL